MQIINKRKPKGDKRGQSFIELLIVTLVLALILVGVVEFGFLLNQYLHILDGTREAARFSSSSVAFYPNGTSINEFYVNTAIQAGRTMDPVHLNPASGDDLIVSVLSVAGSSVMRFPGPNGWSLCEHYSVFAAAGDIPPALADPTWWSCSPRDSNFTSGQILDLLDANAPPSGVLLVELYYNYDQLLKIPVFSDVIPDPIPVYVYSVMPISSAEPTPTPRP
jgi:hypothetical protein